MRESRRFLYRDAVDFLHQTALPAIERVLGCGWLLHILDHENTVNPIAEVTPVLQGSAIDGLGDEDEFPLLLKVCDLPGLAKEDQFLSPFRLSLGGVAVGPDVPVFGGHGINP